MDVNISGSLGYLIAVYLRNLWSTVEVILEARMNSMNMMLHVALLIESFIAPVNRAHKRWIAAMDSYVSKELAHAVEYFVASLVAIGEKISRQMWHLVVFD